MNPACFPTPYPGESLYSILCRYHVRSCNKNDIYTIAQLFGFRTSIRYTVLSPALLAYETGWLKELSGITMESLMNENTAFRFSLPFAASFGPGKLSTENNTSEKSCIFRRIHWKNIHPSKRLRYCPKCAAEQKRVFGEAYWGVLPQMAGYEVCHIHGEPIRESIIPLNAIQYKFYPASCVLSSSSPEIYGGMDKMNKINRYYTSYQRHASEINWCYCNPNFFCFIRSSICVVNRSRNIFVSRQMDKHVLNKCFCQDAIASIISSNLVKVIPHALKISFCFLSKV